LIDVVENEAESRTSSTEVENDLADIGYSEMELEGGLNEKLDVGLRDVCFFFIKCMSKLEGEEQTLSGVDWQRGTDNLMHKDGGECDNVRQSRNAVPELQWSLRMAFAGVLRVESVRGMTNQDQGKRNDC
jgi:hypothetical protein